MANLANTKEWKSWKMNETLAYGYSSERTHWELSNEYQHDRIYMAFKNLCVLVLWMKVASALEGLIMTHLQIPINDPVHLKVIIILTKRIHQSLGHLEKQRVKIHWAVLASTVSFIHLLASWLELTLGTR